MLPWRLSAGCATQVANDNKEVLGGCMARWPGLGTLVPCRARWRGWSIARAT